MTDSYLKAVAAENWIGCQIIAKKLGHTTAEMLDGIFWACAILYAEDNEPARSAVFKALWLLMVTFNDERASDAIQARHESEN